MNGVGVKYRVCTVLSFDQGR